MLPPPQNCARIRTLSEAIGIDGTSREGHRYITVLADPAQRNEEGLTGLQMETQA